jgi:hypothetical protein
MPLLRCSFTVISLIKLHDCRQLAIFGKHMAVSYYRAFLRHFAPVGRKRWAVYATLQGSRQF